MIAEAPQLNGSRTANGRSGATAVKGPILPKGEPVFDAAAITLQRRMRFNPLRMLNPERLGQALDNFDIGILGEAARLWDGMCRRDDTLSFVKPQLEGAIAGKPWGVQKKPDADPVEAARHAAALKYFYANVKASDAFDRNVKGGQHLLLKQMGSAFSYQYAVHHLVWRPQPGVMLPVEAVDGVAPAPVPALTAELELVPLWYFENTTGTLRFLPMGGFGIEGEELDWESEWIVTTGVGMMFAASICYTFKRLTFQDWTVFNERYAQNKVLGQTPARQDSDQGRGMARIVEEFNGDQGIVLYESQPGEKPPISLLGPEGTASVEIFEKFLERQDRKMSVMYRGSDLRNMSREQDAVGASVQDQETEALETAHCANIQDACEKLSGMVIRLCFGEGVEPAAYFGLPDMDQEDTKELRDSAGFLADRGALVDLEAVAKRLGVELTEDETQALRSAVGNGGRVEGDVDADGDFDERDVDRGAQQIRRWQIVARDALKSGDAEQHAAALQKMAGRKRGSKGEGGQGRTANARGLGRLRELVEEALRQKSAQCSVLSAQTGNAEWDETKHPRGDNGEFVGKVGDWQQFGFASATQIPPDGAEAEAEEMEAREKLKRGFTVTTVLGDEQEFGPQVLEHWDQKVKTEADKDGRLRQFHRAIKSLQTPHEVWENQRTGTRTYIHVIRDEKKRRVVNAFTLKDGAVESFYATSEVRRKGDQHREGKLLYAR